MQATLEMPNFEAKEEGPGTPLSSTKPEKDNAMKLLKTLASSMFAVSLLAAPAVFGADTSKMVNMEEFMKSCDMDKDGMMSKAEMMQHMEKMFDKMDTKKTGKLDKKQTEAFLKQLTAPGGG